MVLRYVFEVEGWLADTQTFSVRKITRHKKTGLKKVGEIWVKEYLPKHFKRAGYGAYPGVYNVRKRRGDPLVKTGSLRDRLLNNDGVTITSTSKKVTVTMKFGRPPGMTPEDMRQNALILMAKTGVDFKTALRRVFATAGYNRETKELFQRALTAINSREERELAELYRDHLLDAIDKMAKAARPKRKRVR